MKKIRRRCLKDFIFKSYHFLAEVNFKCESSQLCSVCECCVCEVVGNPFFAVNTKAATLFLII